MRYQLKQIQCRPWIPNRPSLRIIESPGGNNSGGAVRLQP